MSDAKTVFSLSLRDQASQQLKSFAGSFRQTTESLESFGDGGGGQGVAQLAVGVTSLEGAMTMLGATAPQVGIAMAALNFGGQAIDAARSAAEIQALETSFNRLAGNVGASGASMLASMQAASSGMISDMDLMLAANTAMALGVADNSQEMTSLLQVAIAKGAELGVAPMKAFGDLINGLGRMSPEILNNIGVVVNAQTAYAAYAQSIGVTVDQLNEQQKMQALVNAVLAATPDAAVRTAQIADSGAAAFDRWGAATANASQVWGQTFLPVVATGLDLLTSLVDVLGKVGNAINILSTTDASAASWTPEMVEAQIAKVEAALAAYQDPKQYPQTAQTQMLIESAQAQLADLRTVLAGTTAAATDS